MVVVGLNVPAFAAGVPTAGAMLQVTPFESVVVAATEKVSAVAMAARAIGTLTETLVDDEEDEDEEEEEDVELEDDDELDIEEEEDEDEVGGGPEFPFDPPPPHAGKMAAQASMPAINTGATRRSSLWSAFADRPAPVVGSSGAVGRGAEMRLDGVDRVSSRILGDL